MERQLSKRTVYSHCMYVGKLIEQTDGGDMGSDEIRAFMRGYMGASVSGYSNALKALRIFFRDYLKQGGLVDGFKFPATPFKPRIVPSRKEMAEFFEEMPNVEGRLYFLLYASSGLRRREALGLRPKDVNTERRMVTPGKGIGGTKNTWVSFWGEELEEMLRDYTPKNGKRWIPVKTDEFYSAWSVPERKTGLRITPQVLRDWFCVTMGELGVQDRYVDAFCGRLPASVLAKHYTDYSPARLKTIYDKACLKVF